MTPGGFQRSLPALLGPLRPGGYAAAVLTIGGLLGYSPHVPSSLPTCHYMSSAIQVTNCIYVTKAGRKLPSGKEDQRAYPSPLRSCFPPCAEGAEGGYARAMPSHILWSSGRTLEHESLPDDQVREGSPTTAVWEAPVADLTCGLWEHTVGVSTDVESAEVFVVISGRASIEIEGEPTLEIGPGDVVELAAGARTVWHVTQTLRKFWVMPG